MKVFECLSPFQMQGSEEINQKESVHFEGFFNPFKNVIRVTGLSGTLIEDCHRCK